MSRQPKRDQTHLHASMTPFGAIDFVDNSSVYAGAPIAAGIVGGPPAFLDAHGIRYVPVDATTLTSEPSLPSYPGESALDLQPMWKPNPEFDAQSLNSRVDSRIKAYMATVENQKQASELSRKITKLQAEVASSGSRAPPMARASVNNQYGRAARAPVLSARGSGDDVSQRLRKLEADIRASSARSGPMSSRANMQRRLDEYDW